MAAIANKALAEDRKEAHRSYLQRAILNSPGLVEVQKVLRAAHEDSKMVDLEEHLFGRRMAGQERATNSEQLNSDDGGGRPEQTAQTGIEKLSEQEGRREGLCARAKSAWSWLCGKFGF
jgi:hypothetical protein